MTEELIWQHFKDELARLSGGGETLDLWLRDDDAVVPSAALDRLLTLTAGFGVPSTIAVIPKRSGAALARYLGAADLAAPVIHGWSHDNHAPAGQKKQELGSHRPLGTILEDLSTGLAVMRGLYGEKLVPMLVPPWNRIDAAVVPHLAALGFSALSTYGEPSFAAYLPIINTHVDIIDWQGSRGCRSHAALAGDILGQLRRNVPARKPTGILSHHLVHDEAAWNFLQKLFELTNGQWKAAGHLIGESRSPGS